MFDAKRSVASVVAAHSECAEVFQRHRIDFCCHGELTLEDAAQGRALELSALLLELAWAIERRIGVAIDVRSLPTPALLQHIVATHHDLLRRLLPVVNTLSLKVARVHGDRNPKLLELHRAILTLCEVTLPHLDAEEQSVFPLLATLPPGTPVSERLLAAMAHDHVEVVEGLEEIRALADDFVPPAWACRSYRTLLFELEDLEADTLLHVHTENHVLRPRFEARAAP